MGRPAPAAQVWARGRCAAASAWRERRDGREDGGKHGLSRCGGRGGMTSLCPPSLSAIDPGAGRMCAREWVPSDVAAPPHVAAEFRAPRPNRFFALFCSVTACGRVAGREVRKCKRGGGAIGLSGTSGGDSVPAHPPSAGEPGHRHSSGQARGWSALVFSSGLQHPKSCGGR